MDERLKAYIAAMVDAEGVITVTKFKGRGVHSKNGREWLIRPLVLVTNSHAGLIGFLRQATGLGVTYTSLKPPKQPNWSRIHRWQVVSAQARQLLIEIRPYLVIKAHLADVILSMPVQSKGGKRQEDALAYERQLEIVEIVRALNDRGQDKPTLLSSFPADHPLISALP